MKRRLPFNPEPFSATERLLDERTFQRLAEQANARFILDRIDRIYSYLLPAPQREIEPREIERQNSVGAGANISGPRSPREATTDVQGSLLAAEDISC